MPEAETAHKAASSLRKLLTKNLVAVALVFLALEVWRPYFFLTDDNIDQFFPVLTGMGRRLLHGESPFVCDYLYGGNFNLLRDSSNFLWHPIYLIAGVIANTPLRFATIDFIVCFFIMVGAAGFVCLGDFLRKEFKLDLSDGWLMFYTLSFSFSMILLCIGPSWMNFLGNNSAMPWLALGILQKEWKRGLGLVALFSVHHLLGGHVEPAVSTTLFLTLFAIGVAICQRSIRPVVWWFGGCAIAVVLISPLLLQVLDGFLGSNRSAGEELASMNQFRMPPGLFAGSYFLSTFAAYLNFPYKVGECAYPYICAFASSLGAWAILPALASRSPWTRLQTLSLALAGFGVLMVIRPDWLSAVLLQLPLLKSTRWPFREIIQFQFFIHLFFLLRPFQRSAWLGRGLVALGAAIYLVPLLFMAAPSFNPMPVDRDLLFSGRADHFWQRVKPLLGPDDVLVPVKNPAVLNHEALFHIPLSLCAVCNYPALFRVRSATGYSLTVPVDQLYLRESPMVIWGFFNPADEKTILAEHPSVRFVTLESLNPLRITLSVPNGTAVDLTPLIPPP